MSYNVTIDDSLRFGDVVKGYLCVAPKVDKPFIDNKSDVFTIKVNNPLFSVVIDPCCEIGNGSVSLVPLEEVNSRLWDIAYLASNMTLLNIPGNAKNLMHPSTWNKLVDEEKKIAIQESDKFGHTPFFVYEGNALFPEYSIIRENRYTEVIDSISKLPKYEIKKEKVPFTTNHRMINFKNIYQLSCDKIVTAGKPLDEVIKKSIVLQLSKTTRNQLREKLSYYFRKKPAEDEED
jgi:hypothetical protein